MQHIQPLLEKIGLNHHESTIYLHLLYQGELPASYIAHALKLPRSTTRGILDKLCEIGIVSKLYKRNTQYYFCNRPNAITQYLERSIELKQEQLEEVKNVLPMLDSIHAQKGIVPKVQVFEGPEQVIEALNSSLFQDITELLVFTSYEFLENPLIRKNDKEFFMKRRIQKGIYARVLVGKTTESSKLVKKAPGELRERRFISPQYELPGNVHIYANTVVYFSASKNEYLAVLIQSKMIADTMRALFEFMWKQCK